MISQRREKYSNFTNKIFLLFIFSSFVVQPSISREGAEVGRLDPLTTPDLWQCRHVLGQVRTGLAQQGAELSRS